MSLRQTIWDAYGLDRTKARPCDCRDSVPMPGSDDGTGYRITCAFCWSKTREYPTAERALAAWNAGKRSKSQ